MILALAFCTSFAWGVERKAGIDIVRVALDWAPTGGRAPLYVTMEKGYFEEVGISARVFRGYGSSQTITELDQGEFDFGLVDTTVLILHRKEGGHTKLVGIFCEKTPIVFVSLRESGINEPKDLEGKTLGSTPWDAIRKILPIFCEINGVDYDSIKIVGADVAVLTPLLMNKEVDFRAAWVNDVLPQIEAVAKSVGKDLNMFSMADYGLDPYSLGYATTEKIIKENPELVRRFMSAVVKGSIYAILHPEEAAEITAKYNPVLGGDNLEVTRQQWLAQIGLMDTPIAKAHGIGWIDEGKMQTTLDVINKVQGETGLNARDIYTNEFLPGKQ